MLSISSLYHCLLRSLRYFLIFVSELKIELDIFSGVVNPSWILTNESANFNGLIGILAGTPSTPLPSRLGYRGFNVRFLLNDGTYVYQTFGYGGQAASTIETVLLNSHDGVLSSEVLSIAAAAIHDLVSILCVQSTKLLATVYLYSVHFLGNHS